jgi:hypothetical protein
MEWIGILYCRHYKEKSESYDPVKSWTILRETTVLPLGNGCKAPQMAMMRSDPL